MMVCSALLACNGGSLSRGLDPGLFGECHVTYKEGQLRIKVESTPGVEGLVYIPFRVYQYGKNLFHSDVEKRYSRQYAACGLVIEKLLKQLPLKEFHDEVCAPCEPEIIYDAH